MLVLCDAAKFPRGRPSTTPNKRYLTRLLSSFPCHQTSLTSRCESNSVLCCQTLRILPQHQVQSTRIPTADGASRSKTAPESFCKMSSPTPSQTPKPGSLLELHSLSTEKYNDQLVVFCHANKADDHEKWVVRLLETEQPLAVLAERTRRPAVLDEADSGNTTPAPSLEELPPEQGTVLELCNIGSKKYDGMLVEFRSKDKQNPGKYFVDFLDGDDDGGMRVKAVCCRRPAIKSLQLRQFLHNVATLMLRNHNGGLVTKQDTEIRAKQLLSFDPCCVTILKVLGCVTGMESGSLADIAKQEDFKYQRRGVANLWAYEDVVD